MLEKFRRFMKQISFDLIKLPDTVRNFANRIIFITILGALIPDVLSFALKGAQVSLTNGHVVLAGILLLLHFGQRVLLSMMDTYFDLQKDNYQQLTTSESTKVILDVSNMTKSKVFKEEKGIIQMIEPAEIIKVTKDYIQAYWEFYLRFPTTVAQVVILAGMLIASIVLEFKTSSLKETAIISFMMIVCILLYFYLSKKRIKVMREYRSARKKNESATDVLYTEIKSTDFISKKDFEYHAEKLRCKLDDGINVNKTERLKLNKVFIERSFIASMMMIGIMIVKFVFAGKFDFTTFIDVVALSSIYSTMLQRITSIIGNYESIMDMTIDIDTLYDSFSNINSVYEAEKEKNVVSTPIESMTITEFTVTQDRNGAFELINNSVFSLKSGDTIMAHGRTGCGKSTLISMVTGKMGLVTSPIKFSNGKSGYLNSIGYQTDKAMVNNFVLNEITLTDDYKEIDKVKLFYILKGLKLFDEILRMIKKENFKVDLVSDEDKVFEFLKVRKTSEFSSGQMQRLALAKLLYLLDDTIQLVALDEPFNRLDDATCNECMNFVKDVVLKSGQRILIVATHQVEICKKYCNVDISFGADLEKSIIKVSHN